MPDRMLDLLLVEDDAGLVADLRPVLKRAGYAVEVSDNGTDAAFLGGEEGFDAIILDLGLPGKPGLEVLREWRAAMTAVDIAWGAFSCGTAAALAWSIARP